MNLQNLLMDIFTAEDQLEPFISSAHNDAARSFFLPDSIREGRQPGLASSTVKIVEESLNKVRKAGRVKDVSVEQLSHLQKLCLSSISCADGVGLNLPRDLSKESTDDWVLNLEISDCSLRASRLLLQVLSVGLDKAQLYSENMLQELLLNLKHVLETCIIPLAEMRCSASDVDLFQVQPESLSLVLGLMQRAGRILNLLGNVSVNVDLSESSIATMEFLAMRLVFVENATSEKESVLGVQKVETLRRHAMDVTAGIFRAYGGQRQYIFDEILSSLEKLPVTRQSARQFKIANAKPIQLVSALIMQLVQTSTIMSVSEEKFGGEHDGEAVEDLSNDSSSSSNEDNRRIKHKRRALKISATAGPLGPIEQLTVTSKRLMDAAQSNAVYVIRYLVQRALKSSKGGDQPYRNLLDIFTEDFLSVVDSPDWPAAELLLRALLSSLFGIHGDEKSAAPAKNMALDLMGTIGSTIAEIRSHATRATETIVTGEVHIPNMVQLLEDSLEGKMDDIALLCIPGPYQFLVERIQRQAAHDIQLQSAHHFHLASWAQKFSSTSTSLQQEEDRKSAALVVETAEWLSATLKNPESVTSGVLPESLPDPEARLNYSMILLNMPLCKAFDSLLTKLISSLASPHATTRSRSIKSVVQLLEKDPSILDRSAIVMNRIMKCAGDQSPLVRDSALGLIGKCITLRPGLEGMAASCFIERSSDASIGVRKRSLKLLQEVYLRSKSLELKAAVVDAILGRLDDLEQNVVELARQTIEDIWLSPFYGASMTADSRLRFKRDLEQHASLIVTTAKRGDEVLAMLWRLFGQALKKDSKHLSDNLEVCKALVETLFDWIIDNDQSNGRPSQKDCLVTLTIFAKAEPKLFNGEQMTTLRPYIENLASVEDLIIYRSVVTVYRRVLPVLAPLQRNFLVEVQDVLLKTVQRLGNAELSEVAVCLWIIDGVLKNTDRLARLMASVLSGIQQSEGKDLRVGAHALRLSKYMALAGHFGRACNLDGQMDFFKQKFPQARFKSVSELVIETLLPFASVNTPLAIKEAALEAMCLVCQAWPKGYQKPQASTVFRVALEGSEPKLKMIVLSGVRDFYVDEEDRAKSMDEAEAAAGAVTGGERLGQSMVLSDNDGASTSIAHQFLPYILRSALANLDDLALIATEIIASINRQGLVHPKEIGSALIALETSPVPAIAKMALNEHRDMHSKHESMLDKEYQNALEQVFTYSRDTVGSITGVDSDHNPTLGPFYEVLKSGSVASRKKLLGGLCTRLDADISKVATGERTAQHFQFAKFILVNLGLLEYGRIDELLGLINGLEKVFTTTGNAIAQQLEPVIALHLQSRPGEGEYVQAIAQQETWRPELARLVDSSKLLSMLWETRTHLRRSWGLQASRSGKAKPVARDASKAPVRSNVSSEEFLGRLSGLAIADEHEESLLKRAQSFLELMAVDGDLNEASDDEMDNESRYGTPSDFGTEGSGSRRGSMAPPSGGKKKRGSLSASSTPQKPARQRSRPPLAGRRRSSKGAKKDGGEDAGGWD